MGYRYYTCDVFTDTRFGGNQLAVLPEAAGLVEREMQQIAREFNYSETAFVLPPEWGRARVFTPVEDAATGSANCALVGLLSHCGAAADGTVAFRIAQGEDMGRPSLLEGRAEKLGGAVVATRIGGSSVMVSEGTITP